MTLKESHTESYIGKLDSINNFTISNYSYYLCYFDNIIFLLLYAYLICN